MQIEDFGKWNSIVDKIKKVSIDNGFKTYIVGGFVRDILLNIEPKDLDIMVDLPEGGVKLAEIISKIHNTHPPVIFPTFGTAKLTLDGEDIEFVHPRKEVYKEDNRRPETSSASIYEDAIRRDFSVNSLFIDIDTCEVLDLTGNGFTDLRDKILRVSDPTNPDIIFQQDPLRLIRLVRFSGKLGFEIDPFTLESAIRNAEKIKLISKERIQDELNKILSFTTPSNSLALLKNIGLLKYISSDLDALESSEEEPDKDCKNVWIHTLKVIDQTPNKLVVRLSALLHDVGKPQTKTKENDIIHFLNHEKIGAKLARKILNDLRYSDEIIKEVVLLVQNHMRPHFYSDEWKNSAVRRLELETSPYTNDLFDLNMADVTSKYPDKKIKHDARIMKLKERMKILNEEMNTVKIKSPLSGDDLMEMFPERKPGPWISKLKDFLLNEVLEERLAQFDLDKAKKLVETMEA